MRLQVEALRTLFGVRVLFKIPWVRVLRIVCLVAWGAVAIDMLALRADLQNPTAIGTDTSNYYAAGQRLNAGHDLYALTIGDRQVGNGLAPNPWSYPLLSPPPIAVVWRALAVLPGDSSMYLWWLAGAASMIGLIFWLILRCRPAALPVLVVLLPFAGIEAWSGNANAFLIPILAAVWLLAQRGHSATAGSLVGVSLALKLMPGILIWWFLLKRDWRALRACAVAVAAAAGITLLGAGPSSATRYLEVAREANSVGLYWLSPVSIAMQLGLGTLAPLVPYALAGGAAALAWRWRRRPGLCYAACVVGLVLGTPDLRPETLSWLALVVVPWASEPMPSLIRRFKRSGENTPTSEPASPVVGSYPAAPGVSRSAPRWTAQRGFRT
jgi:hypothetical protein